MIDYQNQSPNPIASTAERTLRVLECVLAQPDGISPQDILEQVDISRSTLFLLLRTLKKLGYLEQSERRGRYRSGPRLLSWRAAPGDARQDLLAAFFQEASSRAWPETLVLAATAPGGFAILAQVEPDQQVRSVYTSGEVLEDLASVRPILTPHPDESVLANGYALAQSADLLELALPVCPDGSRPEAAILLSAPAFRWSAERMLASWLAELRAMAARLSYRLGAPTYSPYHRQAQAALPPAAPLSASEISAFLQGPWTARLACLRPDGSPHVIPVWQEWDGVGFTVIAWEGSQWADFVSANPAVSLTVDEPWPPLRRVTARGRAGLLPIPPASSQLDGLVQRFTARYLGQPNRARTAGRVTSAFYIQVDHLRGWQGLPSASESQ